MGVEIEAKIKVESHDAVRVRLAEAGGERLGCVLESNRIFDRADGSLRAQGRGLRVRTCRPIDSKPVPATLTYKGPREKSELKRRQEIETTVGDSKATRALLEALGFVERVHFEKKRESWRLGRCRVELDEVPHLGCFVEIEGQDEEQIRQVQATLGLDDQTPIRKSYIALLVQFCEERDIPITRITFD